MVFKQQCELKVHLSTSSFTNQIDKGINVTNYFHKFEWK